MALERPALRSRLFRIIGIGPNDGYFREFETDTTRVVNDLVQEGLWNAQTWMVSNTPGRRWRKAWTITAAEVVTDTQYGRPQYYAPLPADFMRLDADETSIPGVFDEQGFRYGALSNGIVLGPTVGDVYWIENDRLYFSAGSRNPAGLVVRYIYYLPTLDADDEDIEFPERYVDLAAYEAAIQGIHESWAPLNDRELRTRIYAGLTTARDRVAKMERRTRAPVMFNRGSTERAYSSQRLL